MSLSAVWTEMMVKELLTYVNRPEAVIYHLSKVLKGYSADRSQSITS